MKNKIIIIGKGGSGKDHAKNILIRSGYLNDISLTTRKPRDGEISGDVYDFVPTKVFLDMITDHKFVQYNYFESNNSYYGTTKESFNKNSVFIMSPEAMASLNEEQRSESFVLYLDIDEETRRHRLSQRTNSYSVDDRLYHDKIDFQNFSQYDYRITDQNFKDDFLVDLVKSHISC